MQREDPLPAKDNEQGTRDKAKFAPRGTKTFFLPSISVKKRPTEAVTIHIPKVTWVSLRQVAETKAMSEQALLKLYIGNGLRQDLAH
jgi:hypothetical protein